MGSLKDEAFEQLDYLSQLTEIVIAPQNEILARLPDRVELTYDQVDDIKTTSWSGYGFQLNADNVLRAILPSGEWNAISKLGKYFVMEASPDLKIDFADRTMTGTIALVKTVQRLEDKEILESAVVDACGLLRYYDWSGKRVREKLVTVLNIFEPKRGDTWVLQAHTANGRIARQGCDELVKVIRDSILDNKWRIRDVKIISKVGEWVNTYLAADDVDANLGLVNLMKLKIMLDKDLPIYSVDEVKNANPA